ncbi:MAG TPA: aminoacyl-tRNA hydrolase [Pyrinomonadaceae bacterium]|nr:aminoacyl-tRNA hydrolase [Pyrinomonadaceae bacterium]
MAISNRQYLIVGLGNPGKEYQWSRHNLGFMLIDKLAGDARIEVKKRECQSLVGHGEIEDCAVRLVKPQTYMNLTGEAVACLLARHEPPDAGEKLIVISDDLALPFGKIRIRARGTAGGHNGLKSIIAAIGTNEFTRLRIGIQPEHPISDAKKFVLDSFSGASRVSVEDIMQKSAEAIRTILSDGVLKAMSTYNSES